ncbi:MAG TPA: hypothetical protein VHW92_06390 [Mycobacteriales bacterium]|nr:hypothetical protein [Mycobacteriales bacterium]
MTTSRLTAEEDAELRRLHVLARFGAVAGAVKLRYTELRQRDRRREVRDPADQTTAPGWGVRRS